MLSREPSFNVMAMSLSSKSVGSKCLDLDSPSSRSKIRSSTPYINIDINWEMLRKLFAYWVLLVKS